MKDEDTSKSDNNKKPLGRKCLIAASAFLFLICAVCLYSMLSYESKMDPASKAVIIQVAAIQLNKDPNELTAEDFASITKLQIINQQLHDIKAIEKFPNLEELHFIWIEYSERPIPGWIKILSKTGLIDINKRNVIDLKPLAKLEHLKKIEFFSTPVKSFEPLEKLENLEMLSICDMTIVNFDSLYKLKQLKTIYLLDMPKVLVDELQAALPEVNVERDRLEK